MGKYWVYKYTNEDEVVYVGKTSRIKAREYQHKKLSRWYRDNLKLDVIRCDSDLEAQIMEARMIKELRPTNNIVLPDVARIKVLAEKTSNPSDKAKSAGLKNLAQVIELTGVARSTLVDWYHNKTRLFNAVILGCKAISEAEK